MAAINKSENKFGLHKSENKFGLHKSENKFGLHKSEKNTFIFVVSLVFGNHKFCKILPKFLPMMHFLQESYKFLQKSQILQIC